MDHLLVCVRYCIFIIVFRTLNVHEFVSCIIWIFWVEKKLIFMHYMEHVFHELSDGLWTKWREFSQCKSGDYIDPKNEKNERFQAKSSGQN